ncbi:MAG: hypothetical protein Kilf2KO_28050 [Rhodospirillales bacterium]
MLVALCLTGFAARADQADPRLDPLFEGLAEAKSLRQAQSFEQLIWVLWLEHEDERVMERMSVSAMALSKGLTDAALHELDAVVALAPHYAEGWNRRATLYYMLERYEDSLADIERVLALEPRHFGALSGRGLCLMALGRYAEAEVAFVAALDLHPQMPGATRNLRYLKDLLGNPI